MNNNGPRLHSCHRPIPFIWFPHVQYCGATEQENPSASYFCWRERVPSMFAELYLGVQRGSVSCLGTCLCMNRRVCMVTGRTVFTSCMPSCVGSWSKSSPCLNTWAVWLKQTKKRTLSDQLKKNRCDSFMPLMQSCIYARLKASEMGDSFWLTRHFVCVVKQL